MRKTILVLGVIILMITATVASGCLGRDENSDYPKKLVFKAEMWPTHTWELRVNYNFTPEFFENLKFNNSHFDYKVINVTYNAIIHDLEYGKKIDSAKVPGIIIVYPMYGAIVKLTRTERELKNGKEVKVNITDYEVYPLLPAYPLMYIKSEGREIFYKKVATFTLKRHPNYRYNYATVVEIPKRPVAYVVVAVSPNGVYWYDKTLHKYVTERVVGASIFIVPRYIVEKYHPRYLYTYADTYENCYKLIHKFPVGYKNSIIWGVGKPHPLTTPSDATSFFTFYFPTTGDDLETYEKITDNSFKKLLGDIGEYFHKMSNYTVVTDSGKKVKFPYRYDTDNVALSYHIEFIPKEDEED